MKYLKRFESQEGMSREEMCDMLCKCGYAMEELEGCSEYELAEMCRNSNMNSTKSTNESRRLREHRETENYMFFGNLETMKDMIDDLLQMDESKIDKILSEHDWASDHISVAAENLEHVYNFLKNHGNPDGETSNHMDTGEKDTRFNAMPTMENRIIKRFK
jgi:hypothetical protein